MQTKKDYSYGIVPFRFTDSGELEFFTIHQYSRVKKDSYWIFPKGHAEGEETPLESAKRELLEETGFVASVASDKTFSLFYDFEFGGVLINKEVVFFVGEVNEGTFIPQPGEVLQGEWGSYEATRHTLTHSDVKKMLDKVYRHLKDSN